MVALWAQLTRKALGGYITMMTKEEAIIWIENLPEMGSYIERTEYLDLTGIFFLLARIAKSGDGGIWQSPPSKRDNLSVAPWAS